MAFNENGDELSYLVPVAPETSQDKQSDKETNKPVTGFEPYRYQRKSEIQEAIEDIVVSLRPISSPSK